MPQQLEKQKTKVSTSPSPGLLQRIFGAGELSPETQEGIRIAQQENPNMAPVKPYGFFSRLLSPQAIAYASPGRNIYLNPRTMEGQQPQEVADTLLHEQTHVEQMKKRGYGPFGEFLHTVMGGSEPYHRRPDEIEAFQSERQRRSRMGRMQSGTPSFTTGEMNVPQDIVLRKETGIKTGPSSQMLSRIARGR